MEFKLTPLCYEEYKPTCSRRLCGLSSISDQNCGKRVTARRMQVAELGKKDSKNFASVIICRVIKLQHMNYQWQEECKICYSLFMFYITHPE
jgi:hypothetical protein